MAVFVQQTCTMCGTQKNSRALFYVDLRRIDATGLTELYTRRLC